MVGFDGGAAQVWWTEWEGLEGADELYGADGEVRRGVREETKL